MAMNNKEKDQPELSHDHIFSSPWLNQLNCLNYQWNCYSTESTQSSNKNYPYIPADKTHYYLHDLNDQINSMMNTLDNACSMFSLGKIKKTKYKTRKEREFPSVVCVGNESSGRYSKDEECRDYHSLKFLDVTKKIHTSPTHISTVCSTESNYAADDTDNFHHQNQDRDDTIEITLLTRSISSISYPSCFDSDDKLSYDSDDKDDLHILLYDNEGISNLESQSKESKVCLDLSFSQSTDNNEMKNVSATRSKDSLLSYDRFSECGDENSLNDVISLMADSEVDEVLITNIYSDEASSISG